MLKPIILIIVRKLSTNTNVSNAKTCIFVNFQDFSKILPGPKRHVSNAKTNNFKYFLEFSKIGPGEARLTLK